MAFKPGNAPHFFKIIQPQIVENGRLRIPKKFVAKYAKDLSDHVYLKVPNDELWMVNLSISNGEVWLQEGWKEFAEHYSIGLWHFLVFRYEGNSNFHVLIFDTSASEIEYPSPKTIHEERTNLDGESQLKRKGIIDEDIVKDGASGSMAYTHEISCLNFPKGRKGMASDSENERALQSAKAFTSRNPFFMVTIRPSYVTAKSGLVFAKKYFSKEESANVTLQVADGMKVWSVKCLLLKTCARLTNGWIGFVQDNHVQVGDVCILELINSVENLFNVVIFRASETPEVEVEQRGLPAVDRTGGCTMLLQNYSTTNCSRWKARNSHFHVLIFDMSASEIEYPSPKNIHEERANLDGKSKMKRKGVMDEDNIKNGASRPMPNSHEVLHQAEKRRMETE
ncbi:hypothetical protein LguiA_017412 [Lonicera macranthoides]